MNIKDLKFLGSLDIFSSVGHYEYKGNDLIALNYSFINSDNVQFIFFEISKKNLFSYIVGFLKIKDLILSNKNPIFIYKMNIGKEDELNLMQLSDIELKSIKEVPIGKDFKTDYHRELLNQLPSIER